MTCIEYRRRGKVRGPVDYVCVDPDDLCRYMGQLVNGGVHQYDPETPSADPDECIVCGAPGGAA
jgi:hypothetical protein